MPTVAERPNSPPFPTPTLDTDRSVGNPSVADRAMSTSLFNPAAAVWSHGDGRKNCEGGHFTVPARGASGKREVLPLRPALHGNQAGLAAKLTGRGGLCARL